MCAGAQFVQLRPSRSSCRSGRSYFSSADWAGRSAGAIPVAAIAAVRSTVHVRNMRYVVGRNRQAAAGQLIISLKAAVFFAPGRRKQIAGLAAKGSKNNPDFVFSILYKNFFVRVVCFKNNFFK